MVADVINFSVNALTYPLSWFTYLMDKCGLIGFFTSFFLVYQVTRLILIPLFGSSLRGSLRGSDTARSSSSRSE